MEIWCSIWFFYSLQPSNSATIKYNRNCASTILRLLGFVEDKTCSNSYCVHFLTCFMQEMCLYMKSGVFLLLFIICLYFSGDKDLYILGITCYINTFITKLNLTVSSIELDTFVLFKNSELINHSFTTLMNAHLTHKTIVVYCSYMFRHIFMCQMCIRYYK